MLGSVLLESKVADADSGENRGWVRVTGLLKEEEASQRQRARGGEGEGSVLNATRRSPPGCLSLLAVPLALSPSAVESLSVQSFASEVMSSSSSFPRPHSPQPQFHFQILWPLQPFAALVCGSSPGFWALLSSTALALRSLRGCLHSQSEIHTTQRPSVKASSSHRQSSPPFSLPLSATDCGNQIEEENVLLSPSEFVKTSWLPYCK